jgi:hypothetical protein
MHAKPIPALCLYITGVSIGLILIAIAAWGDYESTSYGFARRANAGLRGLTCPILLTRSETGTIALKISNPLDRPMHPSVRIETSTEYDPQVVIESVTLSPGESKQLEWVVGSGNIDLGNFIFASVQVYGSYPIPNRETTCGIFVIDLPVSGRNILVVSGMLSLIGLSGGLYLMNRYGFRRKYTASLWYAILFLGGTVVCGGILSFMGLWFLSVALLVGALLICLMIISTVPSAGGQR